jgi:opacity protein-like surface antigen
MKFVIAAAALFVAAPAFAQAADNVSDTLKEVTSKGVTMNVMGTEGAIDYAADGTFSGFDGQIGGTWKAEGTKLCLTIPGMIENQCTEYPEGKKSGDKFEIASEMGPMEITIR